VKIMNKKGAELSFNVIIIAILVILVLVVVAASFLGGFSKLIAIIFGQGPDNLEAATTTCVSKCTAAQTYDSPISKKNSAYCRNTFNFDYQTPQDGQLDKDLEGNVRKYHCYEPPIGVPCPGVDNVDGCKVES
jgi:flagellar basal body-associated protein FliL